jgi:putative cardiolipin synthase
MDKELMLRSLMLRAVLTIVFAVGLGGCANLLPERGAVAPEQALAQFEDTALYRATASELNDPKACGLRPLPVASYALAARLELARRAERTLDVQYYVFRNDKAGLLLMRALRDAARRGVRVRVIIDDLHTEGEDAILSDFDALPNVKVRLYNPVASWRKTSLGRNLGALPEVQRLNHRMHNKLFLADNAAAIFGGRNIADEYFMRSDESNFVDLDMFVAGAPVRDLSKAFDTFWNSPIVFPLGQILEPHLPAEQAQAEFDQLTRDISAPTLETLPEPYTRFGKLPGEIAAGRVGDFVPAQCNVVADAPTKFEKVDNPGFPTVMRAVLNMLAGAQKEAEIVSPYFVPGEYGMRMIHEGNLRGGRTLVITNSLASTDSPAAQYGYMRYRKAMLKENVILRELSPVAATKRRRFGVFGKSLGRLHAKAVLVDRQRIFLGSMNLDFRSAYRNTEMGLIIDSPVLVEQLSALVDEESFYELRLNSAGDIEWTQRGEDGRQRIFDADPETNWWDRVWPEIIGPLIPEKEL